MVRIASWNINSVRSHLPIIRQFVQIGAPDVLALQETKVADGLFPLDPFRELGFEHFALKGGKAYHGVAIFSKLPFTHVDPDDFCLHDHPRHVAVDFTQFRLHNFYVPAGGDEPDPATNPKFAHKLDFISRMTRKFSETGERERPGLLLGDLNVAPHPNDVWSHKQLLKVVSHTPVETDAIANLIDQGGFCDLLRYFTPDEEKLYSWWSYRARDWRKSDRGRRLDHIWANAALMTQLESQLGGEHLTIWKDCRGWEKPSDHVPITIDLPEQLF